MRRCFPALVLLLGCPFITWSQEKTTREYADALKSADVRIRLMGLAGLANAGSDAAPHVEAIARVLKDANVQARRAAVQLLNVLGDDAEKAAPALVTSLRDPDAVVKQLAYKTLTDLGAKSLPALEAALTKEADPTSRLMVASILETLFEYPEAVKGLTLALKDSAVKVRLVAISGLTKAGGMAKDSKEIFDALSAAFFTKSPEIRGAAAQGLLELDKEGAAPLFLKALGDKDVELRRTGAQALGSIADTLDMTGILAIRDALNDEDARVRQFAAAGLGKAGLNAREKGEGRKVIEVLFKTMTDKDANVRQTAVYALGQVGLDEKEDIKKLAEGIKDAAIPVRVLTLQSLAQYSHEDAPAEWRKFVMEHVAEGIKDKDKRVSFTAGKILVEEKTNAVPAVVKLVETTVGSPRILAAQVLGEIGPDAVDAAPALQKMSMEGLPESRQAALLALQKIMP